MILDFKEKTFWPKELGQFAGIGSGPGHLLMDDVIGNRTTQTGRGRDQPGLVFLQHLHIDPGTVIEALQLRAGGQTYEIAVPVHVLGQQEQVIRLPFLCRGLSFSKIGLHSNDRMQAGRARLLEPFVTRVHHPVVSHGNVLNVGGLCLFDVLRNATESIKQRIFGVEMKVSKFSQGAYGLPCCRAVATGSINAARAESGSASIFP